MAFLGAILSIIFLGEGLADFHFVGAGLVFTGIALTSRRMVKSFTDPAG